MNDWRETARELIASGMPVNLVCREIGKSEHAVRFNLNINGFADRYKAARSVSGKASVADRHPSPRGRDAASLIRTVTLSTLKLGPAPIEETLPARTFRPSVRVRAERPGVARIREIHQRMIRQGKIPGRDLLSELRI